MALRGETIAQTVTAIQAALRDYIEATYHIGSPALVRQRRELLETEGVIYRMPYIESTPRYVTGDFFANLGLPEAAAELLATMANPDGEHPSLIFDPPYSHQAEALHAALSDGKSLVVTTGTGSGKTESFLLPMLGRIAIEARERPSSFAIPAVRSILLYPMNALVNDQLGRLRLLLGDPRVAGTFMRWAGRPARFARYTSRTLYPGIRSVEKDQRRLKPIGQFYVDLLERAAGPASPDREAAEALIANLRRRGKWPAKPDLRAWYGNAGTRWQNGEGEFVRAVTRPDDAELLTRHEVLAAPPDVLVTNYSMLEYMLMRPLERPVFDATRAWLQDNPDEAFLLVIDEAHLYRGAAGAEVGLLLRRLRARLGIPPERLQVICTSASFSDPESARAFAGQLSGKDPGQFEPIGGKLDLRPNAARGDEQDAQALAAIPLDRLYEVEDEERRIDAVKGLLALRGVTRDGGVASTLFEALRDYPPMGLLVNLTMTQARPLSELGRDLFDTPDQELADRAATALVALGSMARRREGEPGLLPCRVHAFFRGLPGLWACLDPACPPTVPDEPRGGPVGRLYAQPQDTCTCGARVFELYTCRRCGAAYARTYSDDVNDPTYLWSEPGRRLVAASGVLTELLPIDLCLEEPIHELVEPAELDLVTGRLNPRGRAERRRTVYLRRPRDTEDDSEDAGRTAGREFVPCGTCGQSARSGRSSVQDHQTKGDQPFQAVITRQIEVQPPGAQARSEFAPLRGRKVLAFSDSRQTAARLAPNLQTYSMQDVLRPLILVGMRQLQGVKLLAPLVSLDDMFLAAMLGARILGVRLRPELRADESLHVQDQVDVLVRREDLSDPQVMLELFTIGRNAVPPVSLLRGIAQTITAQWTGLQSLALASLSERQGVREQLLGELPSLGDLAGTDDQKLALARYWMNEWVGPGIWFRGMGTEFLEVRGGVRAHRGKFAAITRWLQDRDLSRAFDRQWLPVLLKTFCEQVPGGKWRMRAVELSLDTSDGDWAYCQTCRTTQRPYPGSVRCISCGRDRVLRINPDEDPVFSARKSYYRGSAIRAMADPPEPPLALVAAEHTAQLGAAQADEVFSKAEEYELLFQDIDLGPTSEGQPRSAIDILSCTTTMEVGIDIGALSGVALRNMPPSRASYQQRSGRAGRRGNSVATVVAFGSADSHDEHYFAEPDEMIRGRVDDPFLTLDNADIARRHITAFLLQRYHETRLPEVRPEDQPQLFEVLGKVRDFKQPSSALNRVDFETWLREKEAELVAEIDGWLPQELEGEIRIRLLGGIVDEVLAAIDGAIGSGPLESGDSGPSTVEAQADDADVVEAAPEVGEERGGTRSIRAMENLLDRLLHRGVLPRYAFPTDVVAFHIFDLERSTRYRPAFRYAPAQGLPIALTQYAPGKWVWVDGKEWRSEALYSPMRRELSMAWQARRLYFECSVCGYAKTESYSHAEKGERRDCEACGGQETFGAARNWIRPPGFAHPVSVEEGTSPDDQPARSYATRAKLVASEPADPSRWRALTARLRVYFERGDLLVTNTGPRQEGYTYCTLCGLIEPTAIPSARLAGAHPKPYPDPRDPTCPGGRSTRGLVLGTEFISDVVLVSLRVDPPVTLRPEHDATQVALRTLCEAFTIAATKRLEIETGELQAEFRPALTGGGRDGLEAEIYLYDTLPGGAGFARQVGGLGRSVFDDALRCLEDCPAGCDRSCYRCLRSFRNRFEHDLLDRFLGASLLRYLLLGADLTLDARRLEQACERLFADLSRRRIQNALLERNALVEVPGLGRVRAPILVQGPSGNVIVGIHSPLAPDHAIDDALRDAKEYGSVPIVLVDEIVVSRNLPRATQDVIERAGLDDGR